MKRDNILLAFVVTVQNIQCVFASDLSEGISVLKFLCFVKSVLPPVSVGATKQSPVEAKLIKDGKVLPLKEVEVIVAEDKATFKYKKPARNLSGVYQLKISNAQGEDTKNINIVMQGNGKLSLKVE
jgi:hypothetical protein